MQRREFILGGLGAAAGGAGSALLPFAGSAAGQDARRKPVPYGAAVRVEHLRDGSGYRRAILEHCQIVVGEGGLKWADLRPSREQFIFDQPDRLMAFATSNGLQMRGHTLAWYAAMPKWTETIATPKEAETELIRHIETVVGRYKARIQSWDVVNEAIAEHPTARDRFRESIWLKMLGPKYIETALRTAASVDPNVQFVINDYAFENPTQRCRDRREAFLSMVRDLRERDVPLHAVGIQGHLPGEQEIDKEGLSRFVSELRQLELGILVTELDVVDDKLPAPISERDEIVAERASDFLGAIDAVSRPEVVVTWGITDRFTWVPTWFRRPDGKPNRPLPLDQDYKPKALMRVIQRFVRGDE